MGKKEQVPDNTTRSVKRDKNMKNHSERELERDRDSVKLSESLFKYVTCCMERDPWCCT